MKKTVLLLALASSAAIRCDDLAKAIATRDVSAVRSQLVHAKSRFHLNPEKYVGLAEQSMNASTTNNAQHEKESKKDLLAYLCISTLLGTLCVNSGQDAWLRWGGVMAAAALAVAGGASVRGDIIKGQQRFNDASNIYNMLLSAQITAHKRRPWII